MKNKISTIVVPVISGILGATLTYGLIILNPMSNEKEQIIKSVKDVKITETNTISTSIGKVYNSVVVVENYQNINLAGSGTGFVYKTDKEHGYILTNNHVIEGASKINAINNNGKSVEAKLLGSDVYADLAVLSIPKSEVLQTAEIGKSSDSKLGDTVFTIGSPISTDYSGTITKGIISGKDRMVSVTLNNELGDYVMNVMQTDAAINPGNSGGPLVNINGQVIGITSLKLVQQEIEGIGFAIPIDDAMLTVEKLEKGEKIVKPMLGVSLIDMTESYALYRYGISINPDSPQGVVLAEITKDSPAETAGLKKGDIITKIDKKNTTTRAKLRYELYKHSVGDKIEIKFYRDGKQKSVEVNLNKALN